MSLAYASPALTAPAIEPVVIPVRAILPWALFATVLAVLTVYFVGTEQGAVALFNGAYVHEFVHDARHLLGFPCH